MNFIDLKKPPLKITEIEQLRAENDVQLKELGTQRRHAIGSLMAILVLVVVNHFIGDFDRWKAMFF
jgi:hypothetical protein